MSRRGLLAFGFALIAGAALAATRSPAASALDLAAAEYARFLEATQIGVRLSRGLLNRVGDAALFL